MSSQLKVNIGGKEFTLRGDNEEKMMKVAKEVDDQLKQLQQSMHDQSTQVMAIVAALNLAEQKIDAQDLHQNESVLLLSELEKMTTFLQKNLQG